MTIEQGATVFGVWAKEHDIILEDYDSDSNYFKLSIVSKGRSTKEIEAIMHEAKVVLITFAAQAGVNVDGLRMGYRTITESQREESMKMCEALMLRLLSKMMY